MLEALQCNNCELSHRARLAGFAPLLCYILAMNLGSAFWVPRFSHLYN